MARKRTRLQSSSGQTRKPERLRLRPGSKSAAGSIRRAVEVLEAGLLVAIPTDTFYGIAADPRSDAAVRRLLKAKGRGGPPPLVADGLQQVGQVAVLGCLAAQLASRFWPGPLTLVLPARSGRLSKRAIHRGTVAVRVPKHPIVRRLAKAFGSPLTATSANRTGQAPARSASEVEKGLGGDVSLILDGGRSSARLPSTIVAVRRNVVEILRDGCIPAARIRRFLTEVGGAPGGPASRSC